jgi:serine/threonine protein kinase
MSTTPERRGGFEVEARLGRRGLVEILLGRAADDPGRLVRLEHLAPPSARDPNLRRAMLEASVLAASIQHLNIARTLGVMEDATGIVIVREHLEGATVADIVSGAVARGERVPPAVAARIVERAARGVHHAQVRREGQARGLVHGALAPRAIAVGLDGRVVVHDHGAVGARALRGPAAHLEADAIYGAPELARTGQADARSDVFSLGMILYLLLRLGTPHGGPEGTAVMGAIPASAIASALADLSDLPGALGPILRRSLATAPADRYADAGELADALALAVDAIGAPTERDIGSLSRRNAGAIEEPPGEESTRRMGAISVPPIDEPSSDGGLDLAATMQRDPPKARPGPPAIAAQPTALSVGAPPPPAAPVSPGAPAGPRPPANAPAATTAAPRPPNLAPPTPSPAAPQAPPSAAPHRPAPLPAGPPFVAPAVTAMSASRDEGTPSSDGQSASRPTPAGSLNPGDRFGRYVIEDRLGRGGTAEVYQALDTVLQRKVALKLLKSAEDARARERLIREAQAVATFQHPNSVVLFDVGEQDGTPFIAMEHVRGRPLRAFVGDASIPLPRRLRWLCAVARALGAAHRLGIVHRDVKPSNVMIREDGEVKVLDFGIARREAPWGGGGGGSTLTRQGVIVGTLRYAAPEQLRTEPVDGRADQFAFAMTAFELLAGRPPFADQRAVDVAMRILVDPTPPLASFAPEVPEPVASAIDRALSKVPAGRFATMDELADALEPWAEVPLTRATSTNLAAVTAAYPGSVSGSYPAAVSGSYPAAVSGSYPVASGAYAPGTGPYAAATGMYPTAAPGMTGVTQLPGAAPLPSGVSAAPTRLRPHERALIGLAGVSVALLLVLVGAVVVRARSGTAVAPEGAGAPAAPIGGLSCTPAVLEGAPPEQGRAVGLGACARLALELGVDWGVPGGSPVEVRAKGGGATASVTLRAGSREAEGAGATLADAMGAAATKLAGVVRTEPLSAREIAAWGAADEAGARRVARAWRRHAAGLPASVATEVQRLLETDGASPVAHALAVLSGATATEGGKAARAQALAKLDKLPPSRAHMLRGAILARPPGADLAEAVKLLRASYAEAPDDTDMVALYAAEAVRLGLPEGFQVVDRLYAAAPARALPALRAAAVLAPDRDVPRSQRYVGSAVETLPELGASLLVDPLLAAGRVAEAKDAVALGKAIGLGASSGDPLEYGGARVDVALETGDAAAARDAAKALLADPRPSVQREGALAAAGASFAEGKIEDALAILTRESERLESLAAVEGAATLLCEHLRVRRWLGQPAPAAVTTRLASLASASAPDLDPAVRAEALAEVALAVTGADASRARATAAKAIDDLASQATGDTPTRDAIHLRALALARAQDGDAAATALWRKHQGAPFASLRRAAFDAGAALEAAGDTAAAARAYRLADTTATPRSEQADRLFAAARLNALGSDADPDVGARKARLGRALAGGDADLSRFASGAPASSAKPAAGKPPTKAPPTPPRGPKRLGH